MAAARLASSSYMEIEIFVNNALDLFQLPVHALLTGGGITVKLDVLFNATLQTSAAMLVF